MQPSGLKIVEKLASALGNNDKVPRRFAFNVLDSRNHKQRTLFETKAKTKRPKNRNVKKISDTNQAEDSATDMGEDGSFAKTRKVEITKEIFRYVRISCTASQSVGVRVENPLAWAAVFSAFASIHGKTMAKPFQAFLLRGYRAEVRRSFITTTVRDESQVTPQGRHR